MSGPTGWLYRAEEIVTAIEEYFIFIVHVLNFIFTAIGVLVLAITVLKAFVRFWRHTPNTQVQHKMARGMQLALQFLLGGEILRTVITEQWEGILIVGAIIVLRIILSLTIHWEDRELRPKRPDAKTETPEQITQNASM